METRILCQYIRFFLSSRRWERIGSRVKIDYTTSDDPKNPVYYLLFIFVFNGSSSLLLLLCVLVHMINDGSYSLSLCPSSPPPASPYLLELPPLFSLSLNSKISLLLLCVLVYMKRTALSFPLTLCAPPLPSPYLLELPGGRGALGGSSLDREGDGGEASRTGRLLRYFERQDRRHAGNQREVRLQDGLQRVQRSGQEVHMYCKF